MKINTHFPLFCIMIFAVWSLSIKTLSAQLDFEWQNPLPQGNGLRSVSFTDANTGTAVGYLGTILRTTDGGETWHQQQSGKPGRAAGRHHELRGSRQEAERLPEQDQSQD